MRRPSARSPSTAIGSGQLLEMLQLRQRALCHEWQLEARAPQADDDLLPVQQRLEDSLVEVSKALDRARQGRLGRCVRCGDAIDFQRLLVHPSASLCWPCQQAAECDGAADQPH